MSDKMIKVTLRRSEIGTSPRQRLTLHGLGLKRIGRSVIVHAKGLSSTTDDISCNQQEIMKISQGKECISKGQI